MGLAWHMLLIPQILHGKVIVLREQRRSSVASEAILPAEMRLAQSTPPLQIVILGFLVLEPAARRQIPALQIMERKQAVSIQPTAEEDPALKQLLPTNNAQLIIVLRDILARVAFVRQDRILLLPQSTDPLPLHLANQAALLQPPTKTQPVRLHPEKFIGRQPVLNPGLFLIP